MESWLPASSFPLPSRFLPSGFRLVSYRSVVFVLVGGSRYMSCKGKKDCKKQRSERSMMPGGLVLFGNGADLL